jgi:guanylate kinase
VRITKDTKTQRHLPRRQAGKDTKGLIFVISGPSGSGKSTLLERLVHSKGFKNWMVRSISCTTRPKRSGEINNKDYFFISERQFIEKRKANKILEWTKYLGYYYATPRDFLKTQIEKGLDVVMCLDVKGALRTKRLYPKNTVTIFVLPPSIGVLRSRLRNRCNKTKKEEIIKRLELANSELEAAKKYDYCIVNRKLNEATRRLKAIVLKKRIASK